MSRADSIARKQEKAQKEEGLGMVHRQHRRGTGRKEAGILFSYLVYLNFNFSVMTLVFKYLHFFGASVKLQCSEIMEEQRFGWLLGTQKCSSIRMNQTTWGSSTLTQEERTSFNRLYCFTFSSPIGITTHTGTEQQTRIDFKEKGRDRESFLPSSPRYARVS